MLNDKFVEQFAALNIELITSDIDGWFYADGAGYEHLDEQGKVDLVSAAEGNKCDEEEDADENTEHSTQKHNALFLMQMCLAGGNNFKDFHIGTTSQVSC